MKRFSRMTGLAFLILGIVSPALARCIDCGGVPEIDPSSAASALALLVGGLLTLMGRRHRS